jgi:putative oxidoreductase
MAAIVPALRPPRASATLGREEKTMFEQQPRPFFPVLRPLYASLETWSWVIVRCACGLILAVHGWGKISRGAEAMAPAFVKMGYEHPVALVYLLIFVEFVGGLAIAAGLFTRFFAAAVTIEMAVITFVHYLPNGFSWLNRGYEFTLMWGLLALAILIRGGGPHSLDRRIGVEL